MSEGLVLDPVEWNSERVELDLNALGLSVRAEGLDYGESSAALEMIKRAIGEGATDRKWPNIDCTVPLIMRSDGISLASANHRLEAKVGLIQREGGAIRRDFTTENGVAGSVMCPVTTIGLVGPQGWPMVHHSIAPDVGLKISRGPFWYATVEKEVGVTKGAGVRDLQFEIAEVLGTAPGLIRVIVKNEGAVDWRGLILAMESRDYSPAATALPKYEAQKLTVRGGAAVVTFEGRKMVESPALTSGWTTILSDEITGGGHMTHRGIRRMWMRIFDAGTVPGNIQLRLLWRTLGQAVWTENDVMATALVGGFSLIDVGDMRPFIASLGGERCEWKLSVRDKSGGGAKIRIGDVYPLPVEQFLTVSDSSDSPVDGEPAKSPGTVTGTTGGSTVNWTTPGNAKAIDGSVAKAALSAILVSHNLQATNFGFAIPAGSTIQGITARVYRGATAANAIFDNNIVLVKAGLPSFALDKARVNDAWPVGTSVLAEYGGQRELWNNTWTPTDINSAEFGIAICAYGKAAAEAQVDALLLQVAYTEVGNENRICFATRSVELRSDGCVRQHMTDDVWGPLIPEGFLPFAPPSALEDRPLRGVLIPSTGDLGARVDGLTVSPGSKVLYRPGYLFAREAA